MWVQAVHGDVFRWRMRRVLIKREKYRAFCVQYARDDRHMCRSITRYSFGSQIIGARFLLTGESFQKEGATPHTENVVLDARYDAFRPKMWATQ